MIEGTTGWDGEGMGLKWYVLQVGCGWELGEVGGSGGDGERGEGGGGSVREEASS